MLEINDSYNEKYRKKTSLFSDLINENQSMHTTMYNDNFLTGIN